MKRNIILCILIIAIAGCSNHKPEENYVNIPKNEDKSNISSEDDNVVSKESILKLAENSGLKINTEFNLKIDIDDYFEENTYKTISLEYLNNKLYLVADTNKTVVSDFNEEIVTFVDAQNSCSLSEADILILTAKGNLYVLWGGDFDDSRFNSEEISKIKNSNSFNLNLKKINTEKVIAITNYFADSRSTTCGSGNSRNVYTESSKFYSYDTFAEVKPIVDGASILDINLGFLVYMDNTISINGEDLIKNKDNETFILKDYYITRDDIYILDINNYLYIEKSLDCNYIESECNYMESLKNSKIELYNNKKVINVIKKDKKVIFTFEDGSNLEIIIEV